MELADQQVSENEGNGGLTGAEIPVAADVPATPAEKPEKLTLRQTLEKNIESARVEEAKRARAPDGKFTKLDGAAEKPATQEIQKPQENAQPAESKSAGPPSAWKGIWDSLTPEARELAVKRESDVEKGFAEYRTKTAQLTEISQAIDPIRPVLQQSGITSDVQAVKKLLEWEASFRNPQSRMQAFQNLARQYGVDLSTLVPSSPGSPSQDIPEPLRPVLDQFGQIQQTVQDVASRVQTWEQSQATRELNAFASSHPHYEAVRVTMGQLMTAGMASDLETAYQKAVALDPTISAQLRAEEDKAKAEEAAKANAEKVARAKTAAVSPPSRPSNGMNGSQPQAAKGVRGTILASIASLREEQRA